MFPHVVQRHKLGEVGQRITILAAKCDDCDCHVVYCLMVTTESHSQLTPSSHGLVTAIIRNTFRQTLTVAADIL